VALKTGAAVRVNIRCAQRGRASKSYPRRTLTANRRTGARLQEASTEKAVPYAGGTRARGCKGWPRVCRHRHARVHAGFEERCSATFQKWRRLVGQLFELQKEDHQALDTEKGRPRLERRVFWMEGPRSQSREEAAVQRPAGNRPPGGFEARCAT